MNTKELIAFWKKEESVAHIQGWDFSHIDGRYTEETDLPWDYRNTIFQYLKPSMKILDIDTGGGEFLLSLEHHCSNISATEAYPPNVELCEKTLLPMGIDFREADGNNRLPFEDACFDMVINRHGSVNTKEIYRVLEHGGLFITEQVGAENDRELVELLLPDSKNLPFPNQYLETAAQELRNSGFKLLNKQECFRPIKFFDVGALVWFARIIEWEFVVFSVDNCIEQLLKAQEMLDANGYIEGNIHRYLLVAKK